MPELSYTVTLTEDETTLLVQLLSPRLRELTRAAHEKAVSQGTLLVDFMPPESFLMKKLLTAREKGIMAARGK
jgi:hypothetical protein